MSWLKNKTLLIWTTFDPDVLAEEIAENLENAMESFREILAQLKK